MNLRLTSRHSVQIPTLNDRPEGLLPSTCLVRVRGMVQEVKDPEFFAAGYDLYEPARSTTVRAALLQSSAYLPLY